MANSRERPFGYLQQKVLSSEIAISIIIMLYVRSQGFESQQVQGFSLPLRVHTDTEFNQTS